MFEDDSQGGAGGVVVVVRAELLEQGGVVLWHDFMNELRETHLGVPRPDTGQPRVGERLAQARADASPT